jgi:calcium-dependent protein kinase
MLYDIESKQIKIIDFGTAVKTNKEKLLKGTIGTIYYIAPEVISGYYDEMCDVWSCGVVLYIILCGFPPFQGKN